MSSSPGWVGGEELCGGCNAGRLWGRPLSVIGRTEGEDEGRPTFSLRRSRRRLSILIAREIRASKVSVSSLTANSSLIVSLNPLRKKPLQGAIIPPRLSSNNPKLPRISRYTTGALSDTEETISCVPASYWVVKHFSHFRHKNRIGRTHQGKIIPNSSGPG